MFDNQVMYLALVTNSTLKRFVNAFLVTYTFSRDFILLFFVPLRGFACLSSAYGILLKGLSPVSYRWSTRTSLRFPQGIFSIAASHQLIGRPQF